MSMSDALENERLNNLYERPRLNRQWKVTRTWYVEAEKATDAIEETKDTPPDEVQATLKAIVYNRHSWRG